VISGTARQNLSNTDFAKDQTDAVPGAKAAASRSSDAQAVKVETQSIDWWGLIKKYGLITLIWFGIIWA
jgi:hypothetical protein